MREPPNSGSENQPQLEVLASDNKMSDYGLVATFLALRASYSHTPTRN